MKRSELALLVSTVLILASFSVTDSANASITSYNWIAPLVRDANDGYLGHVTVGYESGSTATLVVNVRNHLPHRQMNVSAVKVWMDWGVNYSSTEATLETPFVLNASASLETSLSHLFTIAFPVPSTTVASNLVKHVYIIYVDDVNATTGPKRVLNNVDSWSGSDFAVFSSAQASSLRALQELAVYDSMTTAFVTIEARKLSLLAMGAQTQGDAAYKQGDFSSASAYYQNALALYADAWANETDVYSGFEKGLLALVNSAQNMVNMVGAGYILFGLGFLLMGVGVVVYLIRKSGAKTSPPP